MKKWKAFDGTSWAALLSSLVKVKETADANASAVSGMGEDIVQLTQTTRETLQSMNQEISSAQSAVEQLRRDIENGTVTVKPVFPVVTADPASPKEGEAWIRKT